MGEWATALLFGLVLVSFVLGLSSIIMSFLPQPAGTNKMRSNIEYGFFGATGLVLGVLFSYALYSM